MSNAEFSLLLTENAEFLRPFAINLTINIQITSNMQSMAMSVPKAITMRPTESIDEQPADTVVTSTILASPHHVEVDFCTVL